MAKAVIFDLFGTLVAAPTASERRRAATALATVCGTRTAAVEQYLDASWTVRHDGSLPNVNRLAQHLLESTGGAGPYRHAAEIMRRSAGPRLAPDDSVISVLMVLRSIGFRIGLISDASAEIAETWPASPLAALVDHAVFSCSAGALKPNPRLYRETVAALNIDPNRAIYVGDGGGDELNGAERVGLRAVQVARRGGADTLAHGNGHPWDGPVIDAVEDLPDLLGAAA